jgi:hypothetical protein
VKERRLVNPGKNKKQRNDMHSTIDPRVNIQSQIHFTADVITAKPNDLATSSGTFSQLGRRVLSPTFAQTIFFF